MILSPRSLRSFVVRVISLLRSKGICRFYLRADRKVGHSSSSFFCLGFFTLFVSLRARNCRANNTLLARKGREREIRIKKDENHARVLDQHHHRHNHCCTGLFDAVLETIIIDEK